MPDSGERREAAMDGGTGDSLTAAGVDLRRLAKGDDREEMVICCEIC